MKALLVPTLLEHNVDIAFVPINGNKPERKLRAISMGLRQLLLLRP